MEIQIQQIQTQLIAACQKVNRKPQEVTLIGVSKTHPISAIEAAFASGIVAFGENKAQELKEKALALQHLPIEWHFIGNLQRNKAKEIVQFAHLFHGLDSLKLAETLNRFCEAQNKTLRCLVQVNVSLETSKSGIKAEDLSMFLADLKAFPNLKIEGLMTLASPEENVEKVRPQFKLLKELALKHGLKTLSMGMSDDFEIAIEEGATLIRIGTAIFGNR